MQGKDPVTSLCKEPCNEEEAKSLISKSVTKMNEVVDELLAFDFLPFLTTEREILVYCHEYPSNNPDIVEIDTMSIEQQVLCN